MSEAAWDYTDFVYTTWNGPQAWSSLDEGGEDALRRLAQDYFWERYEPEIENTLKEWLDQGWSPTAPIGAEAFELDKSVKKMRKLDASHFLLWFVTFGVALVLEWLFPSPLVYAIYRPVKFQIKLRR